MDREKFLSQKNMSLLVAKKIQDRAVELMRSKKASSAVIQLVSDVGQALIEEIADDEEYVVVLNPHEVDQYVRKILKGHVEAVEQCLESYRKETTTVLEKIAEMVFFRRWHAFKEFKKIVEGL